MSRHSISLEKKKEVYDKYNGLCVHCDRQTVFLGGWTWKRKTQPDDATMDHIIPVCQGGGNRLENIQLSCYECNHTRGSLSLEEFKKQRNST